MLRRCFALITVCLFFASGCGGSSKKSNVRYSKGDRSTRYYPRSIDDIIYDNLEHRAGTGIRYTTSLNTSKRFDIPFEYNSWVEKWVDYFTGKGRKHFARYLARLGRFMPYIHAVTDHYGVPRDLVYLSMIESGFNVRAKSWASAVGPWQFIKSTGAMYGLNVDYYIDERRDVQKSTHAATRHLRDLYQEFGDWYLAFAAYNAGAGKIRNAIRKHGTNFWDMARGRYLRAETKNYVPKILAAALIAKNPEKYGFRGIRYQVPIAFDTVRLKGPTDLEVAAECAGVDPDLIRLLNPELLRDMTPPHIPNYLLKIPKGTEGRFKRQYAKLRPRDRMKIHYYTAQRGDTVRSIADHWGVSERELAGANPGKIDTRKIRKSKKVRVSYRRRGKRRYRWKRKRYTVTTYTVASGARLTIPKSRSLAGYSSSRDDAAAYRAQSDYGLNVAKLQEDDKKKKKKKAKKEEKKKSVKTAQLEPLPKPKKDLDLDSVQAPTNFGGTGSAREDLAPSDDQLKAAVAKLPGKSDLPDVESDPLQKEWSPEKPKAEKKAAKPSPKYHVVRRGETLSAIAKRYGTSRKNLIAWNGKKVHPVLQAGAKITIRGGKAKPVSQKYYRVKSGDTLTEIAKQQGVSVKNLRDWNGSKVSPVLKSGAKISVAGPAPGVKPKKSVVKYKVRQGDSLYKIAKKHRTTPEKLKKLNGLKGSMIKPGAILVVRRE
jgi:LysM repeat protein